MKKLVRKDYKTRQKSLIGEKQFFILKSLKKSFNFKQKTRYIANCNFNERFKNNTLNQTTNRCVFTARKKRLNYSYNFSRIMFLRLARFGFIFGLKKASW